MNWTQPVCKSCWDEKNPDRQAYTMNQAPRELCCFCNNSTNSGIYLRIDPRTVPYPTTEDDDE